MKVIDTTTFFEENMMMDIRFNILNPYVDKFIVCESLFTHSGKRKKINFNSNDYPKFKDKIIHLVLEKDPENLIKKDSLSAQEKRLNSILRIRAQRNYIKNSLNEFSSEDYIIHSDNDEIPNLEKFDLKLNSKKFVIFNQKIFYYKLNLGLSDLNWFGSKACKIKNLKSIDQLRSLKNKIYPFYRLDTIFSDIKHQSLKIIENGGWHFSNLKTLDELERKYLNDENHAEYQAQGFTKNRIIENLTKKTIDYNHSAKKSSPDRFKSTKLEKIDMNILPDYILKNINYYQDWID